MQMIKGLITLLLVAAAVFTAVMIYNSKTEPEYEAKLKNATLADTIGTAKQTPAKAVAGMANGVKAGMVKTNVVARQKIKNLNL